MRILFFLVCFYLLSGVLQAQYWFGPKAGMSYSHFIYQNQDYQKDSIQVTPTYNFEVGGVVVYQATDMFSVQGEIYYERINRTLRSDPTQVTEVYSKMTHHFISVPMLFRVSFGREPIHYYLDGGIKLKYWVGGNGEIVSGEEEFGDGPDEIKKIVFKQSKSNTVDGVYAVPDANIMQFGLSVGGGIYLDLVTNGRLLLDAKYTFGHSNMGFNGNQDFSNDVTGYVERFTFRANTLSLSLAYLFQFDQKLQKKGSSTSDVSRKK
jgi:hypothetical protein